MAEYTNEVAPHTQRLFRREPVLSTSPFRMLERFADEIDSALGVRGSTRSPLGASGELWAPEVEVYQQSNELIMRADLPGLKKEDVRVDVTDSEITISGERRQEEDTQRDGFFHSERTYGSFLRTIPLPEGAMTEQAKASFRDGVLEVRMPAPSETFTRGRRLEIKDEAETKKK